MRGVFSFLVSSLLTLFPLVCFQGMALSGVDAPETILDLITALNAVKPELAKTIDICNDAIGTYLTASDER